MIQLTEKTVQTILDALEINKSHVQYLAGGREDNDGIVYLVTENGTKKVLKIAAYKEQKQVDQLMQKLEFAYYLKECGIPVACPVKQKNGMLFFTCNCQNHVILASLMDFVEGKNPETKELKGGVVKQWGQVTGAMHAATKKYGIWKSLQGETTEWGHEAEIDVFTNMCRNSVVKEKWAEMKAQMSSMEKTRTNYGFIHNDNHQNNIIVNGNAMSIIDFDCAGCHFFQTDILVPAQGLFFDECGGINRPLTNKDRLQQFYDEFFAGYELENHVENNWIKELPVFLQYRRLLLYTVMQDWMESDKNVGESFLRMLEV